ncbi:hypothetical protein SL003B_3037 [Polymorphum gilvum SL003B-26A1]|uniref:Uncharacterized protein n=1 Tax=Polymorphum gilvum (strain LMG 25793 / CGMCC 1.9160 / SL003B-26A1) TaxID=991905 RepID=F2IW75_POLGS|nr:hypothetical protein SL003B_3037 [Polymorphum gilvum SL003B-26A1]
MRGIYWLEFIPPIVLKAKKFKYISVYTPRISLKIFIEDIFYVILQDMGLDEPNLLAKPGYFSIQDVISTDRRIRH